MDFIIGVLGSIIGNFLTDLTKSVMKWDNLFGSNKLEPSQVHVSPDIPEPDHEKYARRMLNRARVESFKWAFSMVVLSLFMLFSASMLSLLFKDNLGMVIEFQNTRLSWSPIRTASNINISLIFAAIAFPLVFKLGQIITQQIERIYDREWDDVTPEKYFLFYMRSMLLLVIIYAGFIVFSFYPNIGFFESFKYPIYSAGSLFLLALSGYRP